MPREFRECWESNVRCYVREFLRYRHREVGYRYMDGGRIPILHRCKDAEGTSWLLSWCRSCELGFLFASSPDYGWECCASVAWDPGPGRYEVREQYATGAGHAVSPQLVAGLPRLPDP